MTHLGRPLPGAALTWAVSLDSVLAAINDRFAGLVAEGNAAAARAAFDFVRDEREALTQAGMSIRTGSICIATSTNTGLTQTGRHFCGPSGSS